MPTRAALQVVKQIAFRRSRIDEHQGSSEFDPRKFSWQNILNTAQALRLADGSAAVRSLQYGTKLEATTFGVYTGYTRHIDIAASRLTERSLATCFHEFSHALLHWDIGQTHAQENMAWLESEADVTADLVLLHFGLAPRRDTQATLQCLGNIGDVAAFFHFAGEVCVEAADTIIRTWAKANAPSSAQPAASSTIRAA